MKLSTGICQCSAVLCLLFAGTLHAELAVIAHPDNPEPALTLKQVKRIYLAKSKTFPHGGVVHRADQESNTPAYQEFIGRVLGLKEKRLNAYWSKMTFTGRGARPEVVGNDADVKQWVLEHPKGLGYINADQVDDQVKVLLLAE
ncbi:hypothetical protein MNBD_GAMMA13-345 [hydrothermal vent metagenome]|uniref:ABC-type phosphate transport system, periplasmic component n=1 Tax=hydrothermal vent metagenome TaxID=652676 RepID=A0A3B0YMW1_9ZZZZ